MDLRNIKTHMLLMDKHYVVVIHRFYIDNPKVFEIYHRCTENDIMFINFFSSNNGNSPS